MNRILHGLLPALAIACIGFCTPAATAQAPLQPPHDMRWGDSPEKLIDWATKHSMDIHIFLPGDQPRLRVVRIEPNKGLIPDTDVRSVEGRFLGGRMIELTAHYDDPEADHEIMLARFEKLRRELATNHGPLQPNHSQRDVVDGFVIRTRSFHREPVKGMFLMLTLTSIENQSNGASKARYSVIYRNENLMAELEPRTMEP